MIIWYEPHLVTNTVVWACGRVRVLGGGGEGDLWRDQSSPPVVHTGISTRKFLDQYE